MDQKPIVVRGYLGWGNRKSGLEAYGPGGRWNRNPDGTRFAPVPNGGDPADGDLLGDALERAGATEGAEFIVIAVKRFGDYETLFEAIEEWLEQGGSE